MIRINLAVKLAERKWSQAELVRRTGIRPNTISDLYHETATSISFYNLEILCAVLECTISDLMKIEK